MCILSHPPTCEKSPPDKQNKIETDDFHIFTILNVYAPTNANSYYLPNCFNPHSKTTTYECDEKAFISGESNGIHQLLILLDRMAKISLAHTTLPMLLF